MTLGHWIVAGSAVIVVGMQHDLGSLNELLQVQQSLLLAWNMTLGYWMNCYRFSSHCCWHETWPWVIEWTVAGSAVIVVGMKHDLGLLNELLQVQQSLLAWNMTLGNWTVTGSAVIFVGMKHDLMLAWNTTWGYWMNCCRWPKNWWTASPAWLQWATCHKSRMLTAFYCKLPVPRPATLPSTGSESSICGHGAHQWSIAEHQYVPDWELQAGDSTGYLLAWNL